MSPSQTDLSMQSTLLGQHGRGLSMISSLKPSTAPLSHSHNWLSPILTNYIVLSEALVMLSTSCQTFVLSNYGSFSFKQPLSVIMDMCLKDILRQVEV